LTWLSVFYSVLPTFTTHQPHLIISTIVENKKTVQSWAMFDWANSVYALVISTAVFPPYFAEVTDTNLQIFGMNVTNTALYSFIVSAAYLIMAVMMPLLSGIADYGDKKNLFLKIFTILGGISCISMFFFIDTSTVMIGSIGFLLATIGFGGGIVFYNAYLPQITTPDRYDVVSAKGFAYGYIGSVICLIGILVIVLKPELFGIVDSTLPVRLGFVIVGVWWIGFGLFSIKRLPSDTPGKIPKGMMKKGLGELKDAFNYVKSSANTKKFLTGYFFYIAGVNTVIYLATVFGSVELKLETKELIYTVLIIQLVAIGGAYLFAYVSKLKGNRFGLVAMIFIWIAICICAYFTTGKFYFYVVAGFVGLVVGGIQSLSRSSYTKLLSDDVDEVTSYFSFYDMLTKLAVVAGTLAFGIVDNITGNLRYSVLTIALFFIVSLFFIRKVGFGESKVEPQLEMG